MFLSWFSWLCIERLSDCGEHSFSWSCSRHNSTIFVWSLFSGSKEEMWRSLPNHCWRSSYIQMYSMSSSVWGYIYSLPFTGGWVLGSLCMGCESVVNSVSSLLSDSWISPDFKCFLLVDFSNASIQWVGNTCFKREGPIFRPQLHGLSSVMAHNQYYILGAIISSVVLEFSRVTLCAT